MPVRQVFNRVSYLAPEVRSTDNERKCSTPSPDCSTAENHLVGRSVVLLAGLSWGSRLMSG